VKEEKLDGDESIYCSCRAFTFAHGKGKHALLVNGNTRADVHTLPSSKALQSRVYPTYISANCHNFNGLPVLKLIEIDASGIRACRQYFCFLTIAN
jgi:hypothetical protein